ncbi:MAG: hypothetical protein M3376_00855 [Actinomycetota bacterium]|nr:hypothetical protein [Actinomycetota bacterium]
MNTLNTRTRRASTMLLGVLSGVAGLSLVPLSTATSSAPSAAAPKNITCILKTVDAEPTARNAQDFGTIKCASFFGKGVQHNKGRLTPSSQTTGTVRGTSKLYFDAGSVRATFSLKYEVSGPNITYKGTAKITSGTGAYAAVVGTALLKGSSKDGGTHGTIVEKITLTQS